MDLIPDIPPRVGLKGRVKVFAKLTLLPPTLLLRRRRIARYLSSEPRPKLHVGCGRHLLPGWLNTDRSILNRRQVVYLDAKRRMPFHDSQFFFIFNEHFISSLTLREGVRFFRECHRVLRPGGVLRTATPGWPFLLELLSGDPRYREYVRWAAEHFQLGQESACLAANHLVLSSIGGKFIYDTSCLAWALAQAGFTRTALTKVGESAHPELRNVEGHGKFIPPQFNELETFVMEATKG